MTTSPAKRAEIDANYDVFQRNLARYLAGHEGQYAVMRHQRIVEFVATPGEAYRFATGRFPDGIFSIQEVIDEPIDLGFFSHVAY